MRPAEKKIVAIVRLNGEPKYSTDRAETRYVVHCIGNATYRVHIENGVLPSGHVQGSFDTEADAAAYAISAAQGDSNVLIGRSTCEVLAGFAAQLAVAIRSSGLTVKAFAEAVQIPLRSIEDWKAGRRTPPEWTQRLILKETAEIAK